MATAKISKLKGLISELNKQNELQKEENERLKQIIEQQKGGNGELKGKIKSASKKFDGLSDGLKDIEEDFKGKNAELICINSELHSIITGLKAENDCLRGKNNTLGEDVRRNVARAIEFSKLTDEYAIEIERLSAEILKSR